MRIQTGIRLRSGSAGNCHGSTFPARHFACRHATARIRGIGAGAEGHALPAHPRYRSAGIYVSRRSAGDAGTSWVLGEAATKRKLKVNARKQYMRIPENGLRACMRARVRACVLACRWSCMYVCVHACVLACVTARMCVWARSHQRACLCDRVRGCVEAYVRVCGCFCVLMLLPACLRAIVCAFVCARIRASLHDSRHAEIAPSGKGKKNISHE